MGALRSALRTRSNANRVYAQLDVPRATALRLARVHIELQDYRAALQVRLPSMGLMGCLV